MNNRRYIIAESIREIAFNNKEIFIVTYDVKENINDKNEVIKVLPRLWEVLLEAYNNDVKGVRNANKLLKSSNKVKVGYYQGNIVAVAFYSDYKNGNKLMYGGAVRGKLHDIGKQCFQAIAYRDIENIEEYNWVEASGSVEKTFKMHNAYMLPNKYVEQILGKNINLCEDGFHYQRVIGNDNEVFTKIIFGINSEDLLNKIAYETFGHLYKDAKYNYEMLRATQQLKENKQVDVVASNNRPAFIQYAINIYDCFNETSLYGEIYEMPLDLLYYLKYANEILKNYDGEDKTVINYSELCEDLLSILQPLEIICKKAVEVINKEEKVA